MKVIIAGSRQINDPALVEAAVAKSGFEIGEVVSGGARGVDALAERWGKAQGVPVRVFKADWEKHGRAAGPIRNRAMADYADALIAIWDGQSRGTANMISEAKTRGLSMYVKALASLRGR